MSSSVGYPSSTSLKLSKHVVTNVVNPPLFKSTSDAISNFNLFINEKSVFLVHEEIVHVNAKPMMTSNFIDDTI